MRKITILPFLSLFYVLSLSAQVFPPTTPSSGQGSHELNIMSSDPDFSIASGACVDLTASFTEVGETNTYGVQSVPFNPPSSFGDVDTTDANLTIDDKWSFPLPLGFNFNFFEQCYSQAILSTNGAVSFDLLHANSFHFWTPAEVNLIPNNVDACLKDGNIFGAVHDMYPNEGVNPSSYFIKYGVKGEAPFRVFTFTFFNVPQFGCTTSATTRTSQMIVLYETTNVVEVYLYHKPTCTSWANGRAAVGIQNNAGTQGIAAPGRNTGVWVAGDSTLNNGEAWQFYPDGNSTTQITWYDENNAVVGTENTLSVCPTSATVYTAELTYTTFNSSCEETTVTVTRCVTVNIDGSEAAAFEVTPTCEGAVANVLGETGGEFALSTDYGDEAVIDSVTGEVTGATPETTYCVEYMLSGSGVSTIECFTVLSVSGSEFVLDATCSGGTVASVTPAGGVFSFYELPEDGAIIDPITGTISNATANTVYTIEYTPSDSCFAPSVETLATLTPIVNMPSDLIYCDDAVQDGFTVFNLTGIQDEVTGANPNADVTFYESLVDAENNSNAIANPSAYTNTSNPQTIYVGVEEGGCYDITEFTINVIGAPSTPIVLEVCDYINENDGVATFDLSLATPQILEGYNPNDFAVTYHETQQNAQIGVGVLNTTYSNIVPFNQTIYARLEDFTTGCAATIPVSLVVQYCPVSCSEIVNLTYCYIDNDTTEFIFSSADETPLTLVFNSGQVEVGADSISVIDSDGVTNLNEATPYGNSGNFAGLSFTSSGSSLLVRFNANSSISCSNQAFTPFDFDVYCSDAVGIIQLNAFMDDNGNGIFDLGEGTFNNGTFSYEINNDGTIHNINSSSGSYAIVNTNETNSYDIDFILYEGYETCITQTLSSFQDVSVNNGSTVVLDFPLTQVNNCNEDIGVSLVPYGSPRPGLIYRLRLDINNHGDILTSGAVNFLYDDLLTLDSVSYLEAGNSIDYNTNGFTLNFNNLSPGQETSVLVRLNVPVNLEIGQLLTSSVSYNVDDLNLENNYFEVTQAVVNSYDPNDKMEMHGREIVIDDFTATDYLYYTVRFQNLGTAPALNVRIEDVLDAQLDPSTFKMLEASHDYSVERVDENLTWHFNNINLPHASLDEEGSIGFVLFRIKPYPGYQVGDIIPNYADIYFDFNSAITTNSFETEFVTSLTTGEFGLNSIKVYPNPVGNQVIIISDNVSLGTLTVKIIDIHGKLILHQDLEGTTLDVSYLNPGVYFLKLKTENNTEKVFKLVKK